VSAVVSATEPELLVEDLVPSRPPSLVRAVLRSAEGRIGLALAILMLLLATVGRLLAPYSPTAINAGPSLAGPSSAHLLGCDDLGRDVFSRFLYGGNTVLLVPLAAVTVALIIGVALGLFAAYRGAMADAVITRLFDILLVIPPLLVALVLIAGLGTSGGVVILTVAVVYIPRLGRLARGAARDVVTRDWVVAAELRGESPTWILRKEVLPSITGTVLSSYALYLTYGIIFVATLSFLGAGAQPPSSDWGLMVAESRTFISFNAWATVVPALGIAAMSVAFTLLADAVNRQLARGTDRVGAGI
jgi:peptide/nickel transport system permease protein